MNKIIGAFLLLSVALLASFALIYKEKRRISQLSAISELVGFIYKKIEAFNMPVPDILRSADPVLLKNCGFADELEFSALLSRDDLYIDEKTKSYLYDFSAGLGRSYRDEQLRHCAYYLSELEAYSKVQKADYPKKRRMILTLSVCAALGIIIIMI
ncbi:MAG: stage III sporulation protein AB [Clostridia bacterium]|nr:stage III sporulation protein AB [Clostridia bacterium]